jgi:hypothetical protein
MKPINKWLTIAIGLFTACNETSAQTITEPAPRFTERTAREVRGATPYIELKNEPPAKLVVDAPLPDLLDQGVVWIQWRVENVQIAPIFGKGAVQVSPRVGHLHVQVDDLPWWWADPSNINTIDMAGLPPGPHKVKITLVGANHEAFPGQSQTVAFTIPEGAKATHAHSH